VHELIFGFHKNQFLFLTPQLLSLIRWLLLPWLPIALLGTAVAFVVGFKNNASYGKLEKFGVLSLILVEVGE
jgi:hypothetical protein